MNIDAISRNEIAPDAVEIRNGYLLTIGRDTIRVVSVFSGTKTASKAIHEAAVKKILFEKAMG